MLLDHSLLIKRLMMRGSGTDVVDFILIVYTCQFVWISVPVNYIMVASESRCNKNLGNL